MSDRLIDDFSQLSGWSAVTSGQARLDLAAEATAAGPTLRLDFDFKGGGGFVVARKALALRLPDAFRFTFRLRGEAPANTFEFKLVDVSGHNVWRYQEEPGDFPGAWRTVQLNSSQIAFAWGPQGGGVLRELGAIEFVVAAGEGGKGTLWLADLRLEDRSLPSRPAISASSALPGHEAECVFDGNPETFWRCPPLRPGSGQASDTSPWLLLDLQRECEVGGLIVHWLADSTPRDFRLQTSGDGADWRTVYLSERAAGEYSYLYLPGCEARYLRLELPPSADGYGIVSLDLQPFEFSRSLNTFFQQVAQSGPRGRYPRYLHGEQSYWTPVGVPDGTTRALLNEEGLLEPAEGSFSLEPFLFVDGHLVTWADVQPLPSLEDDYLPIPSVHWETEGWRLTVTAFANSEAQYVRYRLENTTGQPDALRFFLAIRPFQVNPPWQAFNNLGGVSPIHELAWREGALWVNGEPAVLPLAEPGGFGAAAFEEGAIGDHLSRGMLPAQTAVTDDFGFASGAIFYDLRLDAGASRELFFAMPSRACSPAPQEGPSAFRQAVETWRQRLDKVHIRLPGAARCAVDAGKTAAAHILINRHGAALQPGPRRYTRAWMRDGAIMAAALLRMGCGEAARDFLRWYAPFQKADGNVPAIVDRTGPDWLAEHDSHGQFIFAVLEYYRFSGDRAFLQEMRVAVFKAATYLENLRRQRLTDDYLAPDKRACHGLLPESVSHEGYLAHPVHAYWDDFWALQGFRDAGQLAELLDDTASAARFSAQYRELRESLARSVRTVMAERHIDFIPGSVEWADFDPTATANAIAQLDGLAVLPADAMRRTLDMYLQHFRNRVAGKGEWSNYTPYEIRVIGALVRVGMREEAREVLEFFLSDRRPPAWNQWPEIAWRDPRTPGHIGDIPHTWISAEYILSLLSLFAYERAEDQALVLGAGIWPEWLDSEEGVAVRGLPTRYGVLDYRLGRDADGGLVLRLSGALSEPPGGIVLRLPADAAYQNVRTESPWPVRVETDPASG